MALRPHLSRSSSVTPLSPGAGSHTPRSSLPTHMENPMASMHVRRVTLTSKKNWWMGTSNRRKLMEDRDIEVFSVEMDEEEESKPTSNQTANSFSSSEETVVSHPAVSQPFADIDPGSPASSSPASSSPVFRPPDRHPSAIFSFPTPTAYSAPPNATGHVAPVAYGSTSELFKCIVKKPEVVQLEINGEMQSNASDVTTQFLAELRVYTTIARHRNIVAFLGCLEGVGMVLEYVEGRTLLDVVNARPEMTKEKKIDYHNQLLDGLAHLHSFGLSHGDLSLLNVYVTSSSDTVKLLDFGRSVAADSYFDPPSAEPVDPFAFLNRTKSQKHLLPKRSNVEQIHRGTRPFTAPEILRGECQDAILADAYSFGVILVCLDQCALVDCDPDEQSNDIIPTHFIGHCDVFGEKILGYLQRWDARRRIVKEDMIATRSWWDD